MDLVGKRTLPRHVFAGGVQMVVARRLGRAPEWARPLLRLAAVAGRKIDRRVLGVFEPGLERWLQVCADAAILEATEAEWRFSHDKLRERLLELLEAGERRELHRRIGEAMERVYGQDGAHVGALGYHFEGAGQLPKAARYLAEAGATALRRGAVHESLTLLERAVALQEQLGVAALERAATLRRLSKALYGLGRHADCLEVAARAMTLLGRPIPQTVAGRVLAILRESADEAAHRIAGKRLFVRPIERTAAQELLTLTRGTSDAYFVVKGRLDEALYVMLCALHSAEAIDAPSEQVNYLMYLGLLAYSMPLHGLGRYYMSLAQRLLPRITDETSQGGYFGIAAYMHSAEGDWQASLDAMERWLANVRRMGDEGQEALIYRTRGAIYLALGRFDKVWEDGESGLRIGRVLENKTVLSAALLCKGLVLFLRGEMQKSWQLLCEGSQLVEQSSSSLHKTAWNGIMAAVACRAGHIPQAQEQLKIGLARMARVQPPTMQYLEGYGCAVEAALQLWQLASSHSERASTERQVRQALWQMVRFAWIFPVGKPRALVGLGRYLWLLGNREWALRCLRSGLKEALRFAMPYEQALAHLWLGSFGMSASAAGNMGRAEAAEHLDAAVQQFAELGMPYEKQQAERARPPSP